MTQGIVKWFDERRGYGFIVSSEFAKEVLVRRSIIQTQGHKTLNGGQMVAFSIEQTSKGPIAIQVIPAVADRRSGE